MRCNIPEGVELKISCEHLVKNLKDKYLTNCFALQSGRYKNKNPEGLNEFMSSLDNNKVKINNINVKGKLMYWTFSNGWTMLCTYGMTAQWSKYKTKHTAFAITYSENKEDLDIKEFYFNDIRHFGTIKFINSNQELTKKLNKLGWDPLSNKNVPKNFIIKKINNDKCIGSLLMDQSIFAGVGNYIRAEALYRSKISPWKRGCSLNNIEIENLCSEIIKVMEESYQSQGASIYTYVNVDGDSGNYIDFFKVYNKNKDPEGNLVVRETTPEGRTIHWVPAIQK